MPTEARLTPPSARGCRRCRSSAVGYGGATGRSCRCAVAVPGIFQRLQDPADRGRADPVAEFQQFALDPLVPPAVVLGGKPFDQRGDLGADRRPSCPVGVGPLASNQTAVPAQDGPGVTSRCIRSLVGGSRTSAPRTARSAQSSRGRESARRSTATSCRSTSNSALAIAAAHRTGRLLAPHRFMGIARALKSCLLSSCRCAAVWLEGQLRAGGGDHVPVVEHRDERASGPGFVLIGVVRARRVS